MNWRRVIGPVVFSLVLVGCRARGPVAASHGPLPEYSSVATVYNGRLEPLGRFWARSVVQIWYRDDQGKEQRDQLEGHFQYLRPDRLLMTFDKVGLGQTFAALGSNGTHYWWLDLVEERRMFLGAHANVTPDRVRELGLPVHPLQLLEAVGLTALPPDEPVQGPAMKWSEDGRRLVISTRATGPGRLARRVYLEPVGYQAVRVELIDGGGQVSVSTELSRPAEVRVRFPDAGPKVPTRFEITTDSGRVRVQIDLSAANTTLRDPRADRFDVDWLMDTFGVERVIDLDAPEEPS